MRSLDWDGDAEDAIHVCCFGGHRSYSFPEHSHRGFWELVVVRHGTLHHTIGGVVHDQGPGAFALLREGEVHALAGERVAYINISFTSAIPAALRALPRLDNDALQALDSPRPLVGRLPSAQRQAFIAGCERVAIAGSTDGRCARLVMLLLQALVAVNEQSETSTPAWLSQVLPLLDGTGEVPDLADLVRRVGVSHEHFARQMRKHLGVTPRSFLARCRIERAARQLALGEQPIGEVAASCGFTDLASFDRIFRRERGTSPGAWRRQQQRFIH